MSVAFNIFFRLTYVNFSPSIKVRLHLRQKLSDFESFAILYRLEIEPKPVHSSLQHSLNDVKKVFLNRIVSQNPAVSVAHVNYA